MATIKLSGMMTDIRGKLNGSVFSRNLNGNIVKNNKYGGGQNSARWSVQKGKMSSIAKHWRTLTNEQQQAWKDYAQTFQVKNKVGDLVNLSGFNAFCQINANSTEVANEIKTFPPTRTNFPELGELFVNTEQTYQYQQKGVIVVNSKLPDTESIPLNIAPLPINMDNEQYFKISFMLNVNMEEMKSVNSDSIMPIFELNNQDNNLTFGGYLQCAYEQLILIIRICNDGVLQQQIQIDLTEKISFNQIPITLIFPKHNTKAMGVSIGFENDFNELTLSQNVVLTVGDYPLYMFGIISKSTNGIFMSNIKIFRESTPITKHDLLNWQYDYGNPYYQIPMEKMLNYNTLILRWGEIYDEITPYSPELGKQYVKDFERIITPLVKLEGDFTELENWVLQIITSGIISSGKVGNYEKTQILGEVTIGTENVIDISTMIRNAFYFTPPNSSIMFTFKLIDKNNRQVSPVTALATGGKIRFKAGSELSSNVN